MTTTVRVALLLCDTPPPPVVAADGDYVRIFSELLRKSQPAGAAYTLDAYDVRTKMEYPADVDAYDGVLYTGSAASAYENFEWINRLVAWTASVAETKPHVRLIGICFGHQIIARALGKDCVPNGGKWEVGVTPVDLTETGKQLFGVDQLNIQQMHRDHVPEVPEGCERIGYTAIAPNHGFVRYVPSAASSSPKRPEDIQIFTVQGHPEFTESIVEKIVDLRESTGVLDKSTAEGARSRAKWRNDGVDVIGKLIWEILLGANRSTVTQQ